MPSKPKTPRTVKTPAQRAQEALDVENRRVAKLTKKRDQLARDHAAAVAELEAATRRRDYLAANPDLPAGDDPDAYDALTTDDQPAETTEGDPS